MGDLGVLLGAIVSGVVHARRIADEESAAIAEHYKDNPLLSGMSIPRIRLPEVTIDIPMLIEAQDDGEADQIADSEEIKTAVSKELQASLAREGLALDASELKKFEENFAQQLSRVSVTHVYRTPRESVVRAVEDSFSDTLKEKIISKATLAASSRIISNLRFSASGSALQKIGRAPQLRASVLTAEVKEKSTATNVSRLTLTLKEEGLEWSIGENDDGTMTRKLTPE